MSRRRLLAIALTAGLMGSLALVWMGSAAAAEPESGGGPPYATIQNEDLPAAIQVNENMFRERARFIGEGKQVYDCDLTTGTYRGREPIANLLRVSNRRQVGIHFAGPNWAHNDGSRVTAPLIASVPAPRPARDIAWLLLGSSANFGADGLTFANTQRIQRVLTSRGVPPTSCNAGSPQTVSINYETLYIFYDAR